MPNLSFRVGSDRLESVPETFDVIISRHAPFDRGAIAAHLRPGGYFITQQVGEGQPRLRHERAQIPGRHAERAMMGRDQRDGAGLADTGHRSTPASTAPVGAALSV
jgi:hypothetical protein